jgi:hypothetical protein
MHDNIKSTLNSGNACYRSVQPFALLLYTNIKTKIYRTINVIGYIIWA